MISNVFILPPPDGEKLMILIGVTCSYQEQHDRYCLNTSYCRALEKSGGLPLILATLEPGKAEDYLNMLNGLLLSGGGDVDPCYFGEEPLPGCGEITPQRDAVEMKLVSLAIQRDMPVLAVCRGIQVLNIACGGDIYQDLARRNGDCLQHWQKARDYHPTHDVGLVPETLLDHIFCGTKSIRVNSFHHQAIRRPGAGIQITASSSDGIIEAVEMKDRSFILGVQWHPEALSLSGRKGGQELFDAFLQAASRYRP